MDWVEQSKVDAGGPRLAAFYGHLQSASTTAAAEAQMCGGGKGVCTRRGSRWPPSSRYSMDSCMNHKARQQRFRHAHTRAKVVAVASRYERKGARCDPRPVTHMLYGHLHCEDARVGQSRSKEPNCGAQIVAPFNNRPSTPPPLAHPHPYSPKRPTCVLPSGRAHGHIPSLRTCARRAAS
jgi:hypothetical protein